MSEKYWMTAKDLPLYDLPQIFAASATWYEAGMEDVTATFDLIMRDPPPHRNFLLFGGLPEIIEDLLNRRYTKEDVQVLLGGKLITKKFANYLRRFKFSGDVKAMPEGTVHFPHEPVLRITAPIIDANLFTMFLMNASCGNTMFLSKIVRSAIAAVPKTLIALGTQRAQSFESALKGIRAAYLVGSAPGTPFPFFARKANLPLIEVLTIAYHAVIKSFPDELTAMRTMANTYPKKLNVMVDTYDFVKGMKNAITVAKELQKKGQSLGGITIDSGDLAQRCVLAKKMLDAAGLKIPITLAGNIDEYKIKNLQDKKVPADAFLLATEGISVSDAPKLEVVYKLAEMRMKNKIVHCAKFAQGKESYPGNKQVFRVFKDGKMQKDVIGIEDEDLGKPLLVDVIRNGKLVYDIPSLPQTREYVQKQLKQLPPKLLEVHREHKYPVEISPKLKKLFEVVKREHEHEAD